MRNLLKWSLMASLSAFVFVGCSDDGTAEDVLTTPDPVEGGGGDTIATINLTEGGSADDIFLAVAEGVADGTVSGRVIFTTTGSTQRRLYVTQTLPGGSAEPFVIDELSNRGTKADGSIDLDGDNTDALDFTFTLNVPSSVTDGSIIYNFWSTTGKGDFRDAEKRQLIGVGVIEVVVGTGIVDSPVRTFDGVTLLEAPLGDGSSDTFMSLFNGEIFTIDEGAEVAALWDFGYYYGATGLASFASANDYPSTIVDIVSVANSNTASGDEMITNDDLKSCYFNLSTTFTSTDFDAITIASELDVISQSTSQRITQLQVGDVVEFVSFVTDEDTVGTKGLIRVVSINGTDGLGDNITFDIKVQPYAAIINN